MPSIYSKQPRWRKGLNTLGYQLLLIPFYFQFEKEGVYVAGWGAVQFRGPTSNTLLEGLISVVTNEECETKFASFRHSKIYHLEYDILADIIAVKINDNKLCARDLNNRIDACQGNIEYLL